MKHEFRINSGTAARIAETAAAPWACCTGSHRFCWDCAVYEHFYGAWVPQKLFAFEERECACCLHAEGRPLPEGEEEI